MIEFTPRCTYVASKTAFSSLRAGEMYWQDLGVITYVQLPLSTALNSIVG